MNKTKHKHQWLYELIRRGSRLYDNDCITCTVLQCLLIVAYSPRGRILDRLNLVRSKPLRQFFTNILLDVIKVVIEETEFLWNQVSAFRMRR